MLHTHISYFCLPAVIERLQCIDYQISQYVLSSGQRLILSVERVFEKLLEAAKSLQSQLQYLHYLLKSREQ